MIISHIIGGLGNQMFQYAVARALAIHTNQPLFLDVSSFSNYQLHNGFELTRVFDGQKLLSTKDDMRQVLSWQSNPLVKKFLLRPEFSRLRSKHLIVEPHFQYWPDLQKVSGSIYLTGYWQSEKYFKSAEQIIRTDFAFKQPMSADNQALANEMAQVNAVSLHIRRGDYIKNAVTLATHGLCSLEYYQMAIKHIAEHVMQPKFFIFSDDVAWVKDNLAIEFPCHNVDINHGTNSYNDMRLMSMCKHNIIANSSFSWWGAWLNQNVSKIVIAPNKWFSNDNNVSDLYVKGWVVM